MGNSIKKTAKIAKSQINKVVNNRFDSISEEEYKAIEKLCTLLRERLSYLPEKWKIFITLHLDLDSDRRERIIHGKYQFPAFIRDYMMSLGMKIIQQRKQELETLGIFNFEEEIKVLNAVSEGHIKITLVDVATENVFFCFDFPCLKHERPHH